MALPLPLLSLNNNDSITVHDAAAAYLSSIAHPIAHRPSSIELSIARASYLRICRRRFPVVLSSSKSRCL